VDHIRQLTPDRLKWSIVIVDDEPDVFQVTRLVLRRLKVLERPLMLEHCLSAAHAREVLSSAHDVAVVITDVVMEQDDSGLQLVKWIRSQPHLSNTRIVIRTGQPGMAPEKSVLEALDINDYWTKQDLSSRRIHALLTGLIRSYRDIEALSRINQETSDRLLVEQGILHHALKRKTLFQAVSESLTAGTILIEEGRVLYANPIASDLLGCTMESLSDTLQQHVSLTTLPQKITLKRETEGSLQWLEAHTTPVQQDGISGHLLILTDITNRVEMTETRVRNERDLMRSQHLEQIGMLTSGVAHDLNNLLTVIMGSAQYAESQSTIQDINQCMREIIEAGQASATLVQQLMLYGAGGQAVRKPIELGSAIQRTLQIWLAQARKQHIQVEFVTDSTQPLWAEIAESQIQQLMANLFSNALRVSAEHSTIRVRIFSATLDESELAKSSVGESAQPGAFAVLSFQDHGSGMTEETLERLFQPFYTTHPAGRGLGLATVKQIVNCLSGAIFVTSSLNVGSLFEIAIPIMPSLGAVPSDRSDEPVSTAPRRVLVVDDTHAVCRLLCRLLKRAGYHPLPAHSVEEALQHFDTRVDLVILDFVLEYTTGDVALRLFREIQPDLPAILCSGYISPEHHERLGGFCEVIHKPFSAREVLAVVSSSLNTECFPAAQGLVSG